ncbi:DUF305 domain-containing protein [Dactylosporangium sp. NPDC050688]|uniref:DUF305 domain-containing protein n=1 Tax=Dactylosporangium sp. NPDC050688 TaxID=3157217 RepID=UPI0033C0A02D
MPDRPRRPARRLPWTVLLAAAVILAAAGCAADPADPGPPAAATGAPAAAGDFGGTDIAWVQLMIPMDEQLLPVLDLVSQRSADPALTRLAAQLRSRYTSEIEQLKALRAKAGLDATNPYAGHRMPGLVDADTLAAIGAAAGAEFDRKAAACLREHLEQLASLARSELSNGTSAPVKDLARQVADSRSAGLAVLPSHSVGPSGAAGGG